MGLAAGRACLKRWGFRRCEDICWIKTNKGAPPNAPRPQLDPGALFHRTKEHCLMGIKVRSCLLESHSLWRTADSRRDVEGGWWKEGGKQLTITPASSPTTDWRFHDAEA